MRNRFGITAAALILMTVACSDKETPFDATGVFEATEVTVSAEQTGKIMRLDVSEGSRLKAGEEVGVTDTVQLFLQARQTGAVRMAYDVQRPEIEKQIAATQQQIVKAQQEHDRFAMLVKSGAANKKMLDDAASQVEVLRKQLGALKSTLEKSSASLNAQMSGTDIQRLMIADQLRKCHIKAPVTGVVLDKYCEKGELAQVGKPLFRMADVDNMYLRAYVTSLQLKNVKIGDKVTVYADYGKKEYRKYDGKVTWISSKAEFTPKTILTDDERADQVYAVKVAIRNDGYVKIGMYGGVRF